MALNLSPHFSIKSFTIHTVEGASCVNIGNNEPSGFRNYKKHNQGFGSVTGSNNNFDGLKTLLHDKALLDLLSGVNQEDLQIFKEMITAKLLENMNEEEDKEPEVVVFDNINLLDDQFDELASDD